MAISTTPLTSDTKPRVLKRILQAYQNLADSLRGNDPHETDTEHTTLSKILCAIQGLAYSREFDITATLGIVTGNLAWTFIGTADPDLWSIQEMNPANSGVWSEIDTIDGGDRSYSSSLAHNANYSVIPLRGGVYGVRSNVVFNP